MIKKKNISYKLFSVLQMDVVITQKGLWFFGLSMVVMVIAVAWRIYGMVEQLIT